MAVGLGVNLGVNDEVLIVVEQGLVDDKMHWSLQRLRLFLSGETPSGLMLSVQGLLFVTQ